MPTGAQDEFTAGFGPHGPSAAASRRSARLALACGLLVCLLGMAILVGRVLSELRPGTGWRWASIPAGLGMTMMGLALGLQASARSERTRPSVVGLAVVTLITSFWWLRFESGIREAWNPTQWNRIAIDVGLSLLLISVSLLLGRPGGWRTRLGHVLSGVVLFAGVLALMGHLFTAGPIYRFGKLGPVPTTLAGAIGLVLLGLAGLALPPLRGPMAVLFSPRVGGVAARRMILFLLVVPVIARVVEAGVTSGLYQADTALALASLLSAAVCAILVVRLGARLNVVDAELEGIREAVARRGDWLASVIEQLPEAVMILDTEGRISLFNGRARALIPGLEMGAWLGNAPPELLEGIGESLAEALTHGRATVGREVKLVDRDGGPQHLLSGIAPLKTGTGETGGVVVVLQDVSPMVELERLREEWTAVVAHDLRQPVSVISLAAQQLLRTPEMDPARRAQLAARVLDVSSGLGRMVSDLLDASRIESRRMQVTPVAVDLGREVASVLHALEDLTPGQQVELDSPARPCPVHVDVQRLRQVLGNLLTNAAKYGEPCAPIRVTVSREDASEEVVVGVHNRGRHLSPEQLGKLFQRYSRVPGSQSAKRPGVGLGLYITRGLIEAHGGHVWAESEEESVSVYFALPLAEGVPETDSPPTPSAGQDLVH